MKDYNETIELTENEGLEIDVSKIQYADGYSDRSISWFRFNFNFDDLVNGGATIINTDKIGDPATISIDENSLERFIKVQLNKTLSETVSSFRWTWDKYRNYHA